MGRMMAENLPTMMTLPSARTLAVFGLSGATGQAVLTAALARGWAVRGLVRNPQTLAGACESAPPGKLVLVPGELTDASRVQQTLQGADAVCCVLGPRPPYTDAFCAAATAQIVAGMQQTGITRLLCQTGGMIGPGPRTLPFAWLTALVHRQQPGVMADRESQEQVVMNSGLRWTVIKPPRLTNHPTARPVNAAPDLKLGLLSQVGRASLAQFTLDALDREDTVGARLFVRE
jgi:uncharacterized protein YbjT (DUF2867 family)